MPDTSDGPADSPSTCRLSIRACFWAALMSLALSCVATRVGVEVSMAAMFGCGLENVEHAFGRCSGGGRRVERIRVWWIRAEWVESMMVNIERHTQGGVAG